MCCSSITSSLSRELAVLLARTDLYLTPYRSREQIVSGALSFAVAAGCSVVSTPYFYAEDLLSSGAGALVPFGDAAALAAAVNGYLEAPDQLAAARTEARRIGQELAWRSVAQTTMEVLDEAVRQQPAPTPGQLPAQVSAPRIRPDHLLTLVDDVGIMQHALGTIPLRSSGYCLDDVARLAIVALGLERELDDPRYQRMLVSALAFIFDARDPDRPGVGMRNFMDYSRRWRDQPHSGDHVGRAVWALGSVVAAQPLREEAGPCLRVLMEMLPAMKAAASPREVAFTVLGLSRPALGVLPEPAQDVLHDLSGRLSGWYEEHRRDDWLWFEERLTYDNARLPQALIAAGHRLDNPALLKSGLEALDWYAEQCALHTDIVRLVGNRWRRSGEPPRGWIAEGDEQPLDAAALVEALAEVTIATANASTAGRRYAPSSGSWVATARAWRCTTSLPAGVMTALARTGSMTTKALSRLWRICKRGWPSRPPGCRRRLPDGGASRAPRADRLADSPATLRTVGTGHGPACRRPRGPRRRRHALRHTRFADGGGARRGLSTGLCRRPEPGRPGVGGHARLARIPSFERLRPRA